MMLKAELHCHVKGDPIDLWITYSAHDLLDQLSSLGYDVVAITPHTRLFSDPDVESYARSLGIVLLRGIEARIEHRDVLIYNCDESAQRLKTWDDLEAFRAQHPEALVIAPHPFFPRGVRRMIFERPDLFDAWEWSTFYSRTINMNRKVGRLARSYGKPLVGTGDIHSLDQAGRTFTMIDAERSIDSIVDAIKRGAVRLETRPMSTWELLRIFVPQIPSYVRSRMRRPR